MHEQIRDLANVIGSGHGPKFVEGDQTDGEALHVYVDKKTDEIDPEDRVPETVDGKETDVIEVGRLQYQWNVRYNPYPTRQGGVFNPLVGGIEIQHARSGGAGTMAYGGLETDDGTLVGMTNRHVGAPYDVNPEPGDAILSPAGGEKIGELLDWRGAEPGDETARHDSALIELESREWAPEILGIGEIEDVAHDVSDLPRVQKSGRTTSITHGGLISDDADLKVHIGKEKVEFEGVHLHTGMSLPGDSGSAIIADDHWSSILFAGSGIATAGIPIVREFLAYGGLSFADISADSYLDRIFRVLR